MWIIELEHKADKIQPLPFYSLQYPKRCIKPSGEEARRILKSRQPGNDGGKKKRRHKRGLYDQERLERAAAEVRERVLDICMMHLRDKEEGIGLSERAFDRAMDTSWQILRYCRSPEDRQVAALLPRTYKAALSLLEDCGMAKGFLGEGECSGQ